MKIRPANKADASAIAQIHRSARAAAMPWLPVIHSADEDLAFFQDRVLPSETVLVADANGTVIGFVAIKEDWLNHLYIAPTVFRAGVGTKLLAEAKARSDALQLWTFQRNAGARAFYAKHGFKEIERTDGKNNEEKTPDVRLIWRQA